MNKRIGCVSLVFLSFLLNLSAQTARIWAVNAGSATRYGDFAGDTNAGGWFGLSAATNLTELSSPAPDGVYQSLKYNASAFSYTLLPLQPGGRYTLRLHYNENWTDHQFTVSANGTQIQSSFNPYTAAGSRYRYAVIREYPVQAASDGTITIAFTAAGGGCVVSGIEVVEDATNNLIRPQAVCWPKRVAGSSPASYRTEVSLDWSGPVYGNMLTNTFTVFRSTNEVDAFAPVAVVTNLARFTDVAILPGLTNRYFVKRGALSGTFAGTPQTNDYVRVALPLADDYPIPYRRVWAVNCGFTGPETRGEFSPDTQFIGGSTQYTIGSAIAVPDALDFPAPTNVYANLRWTNAVPGFSYVFPALTNRPYRIRLHFCEGWGSRSFGIVVNGTTVTNNYNTLNAAGGMNIATIYERDCTADTNGQICVDLLKINDPILNGLELVEFYYAPLLADGEFPVTVSNTWEAVAEVRSRVSNTAAYSGTVWRAEAPSGAYVSLGAKPFNRGVWGDTPESGLQTNLSYRYIVRLDGITPDTDEPGTAISRFVPNRYSVWMGSSNLLHYVPPTGFLLSAANPYTVTKAIDREYVCGAAPLAAYQQQRYGNPLSFAFSNLHALAAYRLRLHAAETYATALGLRKVNVVVNGQTFYANFDISTLAGTWDRATAPEFAVQADASGELSVTLNWVNGNPLLAALEIRAVPLAAGPGSLAAVTGSAKVALTWSPVAGADGYAVYRTAEGGEPEAVGVVEGTSFADTTGTVGTDYTYSVRAYNEFGEGPEASVTGVLFPALKGTLISVM